MVRSMEVVMVVTVVLLIAVIFLVGLKPAAATIGFGAVGLAFLSVALRWPQSENPNTADEPPTAIGAVDFNRSARDFIRKLRQRFLSMQEG